MFNLIPLLSDIKYIFNVTVSLMEILHSNMSHRQATFLYLFIYLFGVLRRFQHCTGHITTGSWKGRGNQYIEFARVVYCKLPTNGKQLPAFPLKAVTGIEPRPQRWQLFKQKRKPSQTRSFREYMPPPRLVIISKWENRSFVLWLKPLPLPIKLM